MKKREFSEEEIEEIVRLYERGLSIRQVAKEIGVSASTIRKILHKNTKVRDGSLGVHYLYRRDIPISDYLLECIEGELLGDGCIANKIYQSRFIFNNSNKEYTTWLANIFIENNIPLAEGCPKEIIYYHKNWDKYYTVNRFCTLSTIQLFDLEKKWYVNRIKIIPPDIKITPALLLHFYLGDGTLHKNNSSIVLCSESFTYNEQILFCSKMNAEVGIKSSVFNQSENKFRIFIPKSSAHIFLKYIGTCPIDSMKYKWDIKPMGRTMAEIKISKDILEKMYLEDNMSIKDISKNLSCSYATIQKKLSFYNIKKRNISNWDDILIEKIKNLTDGIKSMSQIAKEVGKSVHTVSTIINRFGFLRKKYKRTRK